MMSSQVMSWLAGILSVCVHMAVSCTLDNVTSCYFWVEQCAVLRVKSVLMLTLLVLVNMSVTSAEQGIKFQHCGVIIPPDPFYFYGEDVNLTCTINKDECYEDGGNTSKLFFIADSSKAPLKGMDLNKNSTWLQQPNKTTEFERKGYDHMTYYCYKENRNDAVRSATIRLDYKPKAPRSVDCMVHKGKKDYMNCNVYLGQQYKLPEYTDVTCDYYTFELEYEDKVLVHHGEKETMKLMECSKEVEDGESVAKCVWDNKDGHVFLSGFTYSMVICVTNTVREYSDCSNITVDTSKIVKLDPVINLRSEGQTSKCVNLSWTHNYHGSRLYKVMYKSDCETEWKEMNFSSKISHMLEQICGLVPNMEYTFNITVMTIDEYEQEPVGFWSNTMATSVNTLEDVPVVAPEPSFDVMTDGDGNRTIRFFWKPLDKCKTHGIINGIDAMLRYSDTGKQENITADLTGNFWHFRILSDMTADIRMRLGTSVGFSKKSASIVILPTDQLPVPPEFMVERSEELEVYNVTIIREKDPTAVYTVFWYSDSLEDGFNKREFSDEDFFTFNGTTLLNVGLSVFETASSGVHWARCVYQRDKVPLEPLSGFYLEEKPADGFTVHWNEYKCEDSGYVTKYIIMYCKMEKLDSDSSCKDDGQWWTEKIPNTATAHTISGLEGPSTYVVKMQAVVHAGLGPLTATVSVNVTHAGEHNAGIDIGTTVAIVAGSVVLAGVLVLLVCCGIKKCRQKYKESKPEIEIPTFIEPVSAFESEGQAESDGLLPANGHIPGTLYVIDEGDDHRDDDAGIGVDDDVQPLLEGNGSSSEEPIDGQSDQNNAENSNNNETSGDNGAGYSADSPNMNNLTPNLNEMARSFVTVEDGTTVHHVYDGNMALLTDTGNASAFPEKQQGYPTGDYVTIDGNDVTFDLSMQPHSKIKSPPDVDNPANGTQKPSPHNQDSNVVSRTSSLNLSDISDRLEDSFEVVDHAVDLPNGNYEGAPKEELSPTIGNVISSSDGQQLSIEEHASAFPSNIDRCTINSDGIDDGVGHSDVDDSDVPGDNSGDYKGVFLVQANETYLPHAGVKSKYLQDANSLMSQQAGISENPVTDYTKVCTDSCANASNTQQRSAGEPLARITPTDQSSNGIQGNSRQHLPEQVTSEINGYVLAPHLSFGSEVGQRDLHPEKKVDQVVSDRQYPTKIGPYQTVDLKDKAWTNKQNHCPNSIPTHVVIVNTSRMGPGQNLNGINQDCNQGISDLNNTHQAVSSGYVRATMPDHQAVSSGYVRATTVESIDSEGENERVPLITEALITNGQLPNSTEDNFDSAGNESNDSYSSA